MKISFADYANSPVDYFDDTSENILLNLDSLLKRDDYISGGIDHRDSSRLHHHIARLPLPAKKGLIKSITKEAGKAGDNIDARDMYANTPLHYAQSEEFIEAAIELGANLNLENIDKKKPTEIAAENNDTDIVIALVNRGANPGNAIEHAIKNGNEKMFSAIIDKIPKEKALDLLNLAIKEDFLKGMEPLTLLIGDEVNHTDNNGTILHKIAKSFKSNSKHEDEYVKIVKAMLSVGANPIIEDKFKRIPSDYLSDGAAKSILFEAEKKLEPNELFLENKPNQINKDLHKEISLGNFENAKKLMEQGGELNWAMVVKRQNGARFVVENWQNIQASIDKSKYDHNRIINKE